MNLALLLAMFTLTVIGLCVSITFGVLILSKVSDIKNALPRMEYRLESIEDYLRDLSSEVNTASTQQQVSSPLFRSIDGKYTATSVDELIQQMMADSGITPKSSPEDLKRFFDKMSEGDEDEDDEDESPPQWK